MCRGSSSLAFATKARGLKPHGTAKGPLIEQLLAEETRSRPGQGFDHVELDGDRLGVEGWRFLVSATEQSLRQWEVHGSREVEILASLLSARKEHLESQGIAWDGMA